MAAPVDQRKAVPAEQGFGQDRAAQSGHRGLKPGVEGGVIAQPHRKAPVDDGNGGFERLQPGLVPRQHQHAAKVDRQG